MKQLTHLPLPHHEYFNRIVDSKKDHLKGGVVNLEKQRLTGLKVNIESAYQNYAEKFSVDDFSSIEDSPHVNGDAQALVGTYTGGGAILSALKAFIKAAQPEELQGTCQYCGIHSPETIDHFLPKEAYPEYAVFALNLVPCCDTCNRKKGSYWKEGRFRKILNFYRDEVPQQRFLFAVVEWSNNLPLASFKIENANGVDHELYSIIEGHYDRLDLLSRYVRDSNDEITNVIDSVVSYGSNPSEQQIAYDIKVEAGRIANRLGENHWQSVLRYALADCPGFISFLSDKVHNRLSAGLF